MATITAADGTVYDTAALKQDADGYWAQMGGALALVKPSAAFETRRAQEAAAAAAAQGAQTAAAQGALDALAAPLVAAVEGVLTARQMAPMTPAEQAKVRDGAVYLASRGEFGKGGLQ